MTGRAPRGPATCYAGVMAIIDDPVLGRFRKALDQAYGGRIERVVLYGSRARGDSAPGSDYDLAVFLKDLSSFGREARVLAEIETDILLRTGAVVSALPLRAGSHGARTGLMGELRRDGLDL